MFQYCKYGICTRIMRTDCSKAAVRTTQYSTHYDIVIIVLVGKKRVIWSTR